MPISRSRSDRSSAWRSRCRSATQEQKIEVDRRRVGLEHHGDAGARHLARDAAAAAAAVEQRPARGGRRLRMLMPGVSTGGGIERVRRADQRRPAVGRRGVGRRRQHAAGLHEPGRHGVDLPGLPDVARHGQRGQGPDVELCARVRLVDVGPDHGGDEVGRQLLPRIGLRVSPRRVAQGDAVGADKKAPFKRNNFGVNIGGPAKVPGAVERQAGRATSTSITRATGRRAAPISRRCRSRRCRSGAGDFSDWRDANGNLIPIYDPATMRSDGHGGYIKDQFMGCDGNHAERDLPDPHQPARAAVALGAADAHQRRPAQQLPGAARSPTPSSATPTTTWAGSTSRSAAKTTCSPASGTSARPRSSCRTLPQPIATETLLGSAELVGQPVQLRPDLLAARSLNHMSMGYLNRNEGYGSRQPGLRRTTSRRSPAWPATTCRRRCSSATTSRSTGATPASTSATSRRVRPSSSTTP